MATVAPEVPVLARDEAFEQLYRQYVGDVYHYALALLRNPADAEDVTQTTFLNAYRAFRRGEEILKPQHWLIKIAHNVTRSRYAHSTRRVKEVPLEEHIDQLALPDDERPNVEGVLRALGRLPFNQRAALVMREFEGRSYAEIGDTLGVSVAAVETLIFRARRSLRMRASALRSLGSVPLPASLAQVFEGGGLAAGGLGTGFLLKAAVALVTGSLATGLGGDRATRPVAASHTNGPRAVTPAQIAGLVAKRTTRRVPGNQSLARHRSSVRAHFAASKATDRAPLVRSSVQGSAPSSAGTAAPSSSSTSTPTATATVTQTADTLVSSVENTVTTEAAALPVQVPPVPTVTVQPPPLPKLP
jgi:RNA polymerase sigma factor (sigma-70 family)